jgi:hypothetical protein
MVVFNQRPTRMNEEHLKEKTWLQPEPVSDGVN